VSANSTDSLIADYKNAAHDTTKIILLLEIGDQFENSNPDSALFYYERALRIASENKKKQASPAEYYVIKMLKGKCLNYMGVIHSNQGNYKSAISYLFKADSIYNHILNSDFILNSAVVTKELANNLNNIGVVFDRKGDYSNATQFYYKALHLFDSLTQISNSSLQKFALKGCGILCNNLGILHDNMHNQEKAQAYYLKAKSYFENMYNSGDSYLEFIGTWGLGNQANNLGIINLNNEKLDSALVYFNEALTYYEKLLSKYNRNFKAEIARTQTNIGIIYKRKGLTAKAEQFYLKSLETRKQINDKKGMAISYNNLSSLEFSQENFNKAIAYAQKSVALCIKNDNIQQLSLAYESLAESYAAKNMSEQAISYYKKHRVLKDSLSNMESKKHLNQLETKYQVHKKEQEIKLKNEQIARKNAELQKQKAIKISVLIIAFILIVLFWIFYRNKLKIATKNEKINVQNAVLHGEQTERTRLAIDLHDGLGSELNGLILEFNNCVNNLGEVNTERFTTGLQKLKDMHQTVRSISHNIMPRSLNETGLKGALTDLAESIKKGKTDMTLQILGLENRINPFIEFNIYRVIQEAINNVVKHADAENIFVECNNNGKTLLVSIEDNGKGFTDNDLKNRTGIGLNNIRNRVKMLNGSLSIHSSKEKGTSIEIHIPIN